MQPQQPCYPNQKPSTDLTICSVMGKWDERKSKEALTECELLLKSFSDRDFPTDGATK